MTCKAFLFGRFGKRQSTWQPQKSDFRKAVNQVPVSRVIPHLPDTQHILSPGTSNPRPMILWQNRILVWDFKSYGPADARGEAVFGEPVDSQRRRRQTAWRDRGTDLRLEL